MKVGSELRTPSVRAQPGCMECATTPVPLSRPALGTLAVFRFLFVWNDYLWPLVIIREESMYTLTIGIANMQMRQGMVVWGSQMAASFLATIPVVILVLAMQRQFLRGLTAGAFKA